jgi:hypothetical protein
MKIALITTLIAANLLLYSSYSNADVVAKAYYDGPGKVSVIYVTNLSEQDDIVATKTNIYKLACYINGELNKVDVLGVNKSTFDDTIVFYNIAIDKVVECKTGTLIIDGMTKDGISQKNIIANIKEGDKFNPIKKKSKNKDDSNVYISGSLDAAHSSKTYYNADVKANYDYWKWNHFGYQTLGPKFDLKASSNPKADADTMALGLAHNWVLKDSNLGIINTNDVKLESDTDFRNINTIISPKLNFPYLFLNNEFVKGSVTPFIGLEAGVNVNSPVSSAKNKFIDRALYGTELYIMYDLGDASKALDSIEVKGTYFRRYLLEREVHFSKTNDKFTAIDTDKGYKDATTASIIFNINKYLGINITYEISENPPTYKKVDSKLSVGFSYKFKIEP